MVPSWLPKSIKINKKSILKSIVFLMPLGVDLWTKFGRFLVPKWSQVGTKMGSKIDVNFECRFFKKPCFSTGKIMFFAIKWIQADSPNRPKIDQKTESKMDGILASIFLGFWSILGAKLGGKPEPRSTQKGIEKRCKKEEQRDCQKSRNKNLQPRAGERVLGPGEIPPIKAGQPSGADASFPLASSGL